DVSRTYLSYFYGSRELSDVMEVQKLRESLSKQFFMDSFFTKIGQGLKLLGLHRGTDALEEEANTFKERQSEFIQKKLPAARNRAFDLITKAINERRPDVAVNLVRSLPQRLEGW